MVPVGNIFGAGLRKKLLQHPYPLFRDWPQLMQVAIRRGKLIFWPVQLYLSQTLLIRLVHRTKNEHRLRLKTRGI